MATNDLKNKNVVGATDDTHSSEKQDKNKIVVVLASDDTPDKEKVGEKEAEIKKASVASKDTVYKRPYCEGFLKFCLERFEVGIWSSAMEHNIDGVLINIMGEHKSKLLFTWDQGQCTDTGFMSLENKEKPVFLKELKYVWQKKWRDVEYSSSNTLLITDPVKALLNPPNTSIFPGNYDPNNKVDDFLCPHGELRAFLDGLAEANDVPTYVKDHPFGEAAITPSHSDWGYYSKITRSLGKE